MMKTKWDGPKPWRCHYTGFKHHPGNSLNLFHHCPGKRECIEALTAELITLIAGHLPYRFPRKVPLGSRKFRGNVDLFPDGNAAFTGSPRLLRAYQRRWKALVEAMWSREEIVNYFPKKKPAPRPPKIANVVPEYAYDAFKAALEKNEPPRIEDVVTKESPAALPARRRA